MKAKQKIVLKFISMGKRLFYNTPIHHTKLTSVLYRRIFHFAYPKDRLITVGYKGGNFQLPTNGISNLPSILNNDYESLEIDILSKIVEPGMTFVDVGANIGIHSVIASRSAGKDGKVFSFEPEPENFKNLCINIMNNDCTNITTINSAVGDKESTLKLYLEADEIGTHSLIQKEKDYKSIEVPVIRLDDYFNTLERHIDVLKIDVEGYEPYVLDGAKRILNNIKHLLFEFNSSAFTGNYNLSDLHDMLATFNFYYLIDERLKVVRPIRISALNSMTYGNIFASKLSFNTKRLTLQSNDA